MSVCQHFKGKMTELSTPKSAGVWFTLRLKVKVAGLSNLLLAEVLQVNTTAEVCN